MAGTANLGLQRRIMLYVALGSVAMMAFFAYVAHRALEESTGIIFAERLHLATLAARQVAGWLDAGGTGGSLRLPDPNQVQHSLAIHAASDQGGAPAFRLTLWNQDGEVVVATAPIPEQSNAEHKGLLAQNLAQAQPGIVVHRPASAPDRTHVVAYSPLPGLPGGVLLEQGRDVALAVPRALQQQMGVLGLLFVVAAVAMAWLTTRQVVTPLTELTAITRRIAGGDLSTPVPQKGQDEVRDLAASFETMRRQLQESHLQLARANLELEHRVQERTRQLELRHGELATASRQLQARAVERTKLLQQIMHAQEEERRRVARDLHDGVGQLLSTLVVRLSVLEGGARAADPPLALALAEVRSLASRTVGEVRQLIVDLRPQLLDDMGLPDALGWYAEEMLDKHGIAVALDVASDHQRLPPQVEMAVFRVLQEAINNIRKHAEASQARISLQWERGDLVGTVADDGKGFEPPPAGVALRGAGVGLIGMRERVALLGGSLDIRSAPGQGTHLSFRVPAGKDESS